MFTPQENQLVLEILNKRRAFLLNQIKDPNLEFNKMEQFKAMGKILSDAIAKVQEAAPKPEATANAEDDVDISHLKVLIVEDESTSAELIKGALEEKKVTAIDIAEDGNQALTTLFKSEEKYDLVLCDWNMPGKTGLEVHTTLKTDNRFNDLIFILVSANSDIEQIRSAIGQGVNDYVVKPIDNTILIKKIVTAYKKSQSKK